MPSPSVRNRSPKRVAALMALALLTPVLGGCAGAAIGAGATVGLAAFQERGLEGVARDTALSAQIISKYVEHDTTLATQVGVEVWEARALLTGLVKTEDERAEAVRLAWAVAGIKDVINEIGIKSAEGIEDFAYDTWITTQLESRLTFDQDVWAINFNVETVNGVVYLIGIAQSQAELDRVIAHARDIKRVRRVISHVRIKDPAAAS
ncbi:MAG: BON domain-containing protein [Rhodospirillales bacterium]